LPGRRRYSGGMRSLNFRQAAAVALAVCGFLGAARPKPPVDAAAVERAVGVKPTVNAEEGVVKASFPRTDVKVVVGGVELPPFAGLTSWAAFMPGMGEDKAMVMGDIVLLQDEVSAAMDAALGSGLSVTALHNHFFYDEPRVYFMHIGGEGTVEALGGGVRKVMEAVKGVRAENKAVAKPRAGGKSTITAAPLATIVGAKAAEKDGVVKFTIGRTVKMECGCEAGKEMGVNTWAAFVGSDDAAIVDGDFITFAGELQPVLKALRAAGIDVVAIHSHMEGESPQAIFLHYWGVGPAEKLARGVKSALDAQAAAGKK
jgi:hypothetical protein